MPSSISVRQLLALSALWHYPKLKQCYEDKRHLIDVDDSAEYFFEQLPRLLSERYHPTKEDFLKLRVPTTGVVEAPFQVL